MRTTLSKKDENRIQKTLDIEISQALISKKSSSWIKIISWSMSPLIKKGDKLLVKKTNPSLLKKGEIICFKHNNFLVVHRIYDISKGFKRNLVFITKPDSNVAPLISVFSKDVIGKAIVLQRRLKRFNLESGILKEWGTILVRSYQLHPSMSIFVNKFALKALSFRTIKIIFKKFDWFFIS